jgi:hypothetical protein
MKRGPDLAFEQEGDGVEAVVTEGGKGGESELSEHACGDVAGGSGAVTLGAAGRGRGASSRRRGRRPRTAGGARRGAIAGRWGSIHRSPHLHRRHALVPRSKSALGSIDPRVSLHGSAPIPPTKSACPCRPRGSMDRSPRIPPCKCAHPPRHALVPRSKCACPSIQVSLSVDRAPPFALSIGSLRTLSHLFFSRSTSSQGNTR